jgi:hypothetical protein
MNSEGGRSGVRAGGVPSLLQCDDLGSFAHQASTTPRPFYTVFPGRMGSNLRCVSAESPGRR